MTAPLFIAIHKHEYGTDVKVFASDDDVEEIFASLPEFYRFIDNPDGLTKVDFASRINIDFEPEKGESLEISFIDHESYDTVSFEDFKA